MEIIMELMLDVVFWATVAAWPIVIVSIVILAIVFHKRKKNRNSKNSSPIIQSFLSGKADDETAGRDFVRLIANGFFVTPKTKNDSKDFDDDKHLKNFRENLTPEVVAALRKVGGNSGQHYI